MIVVPDVEQTTRVPPAPASRPTPPPAPGRGPRIVPTACRPATRPPLGETPRAPARAPRTWASEETESCSTLPPIAASILADAAAEKAAAPAPRRRPRLFVAGVIAFVVLVGLGVGVFLVPGWSAPNRASAETDPTGSPAAPPTLVAVVHDAGTSGLALRSAPSLDAGSLRGSVPNGTKLTVACGATGPSVSEEGQSSSTWLRTREGAYVSLLYARVDGAASIVNCTGGAQELALLPMADATEVDAPHSVPQEATAPATRRPRAATPRKSAGQVQPPAEVTTTVPVPTEPPYTGHDDSNGLGNPYDDGLFPN